MSSPMANEVFLITVRVVKHIQQGLKRKLDDTEMIEQFGVDVKPQDKLGLVWEKAKNYFLQGYSESTTKDVYFSRMQYAPGFDAFAFQPVYLFFNAGMPVEKRVLTVISEHRAYQSESIAPNGPLRPEGFTLPALPEEDINPTNQGPPPKRRKILDGEEDYTVDELDPDMPVQSNEPAADDVMTEESQEVTKPRVDAEGYKIPPIPKNRDIKAPKSRRAAVLATAANALLLVPDSQMSTTSAEPTSESAALFLRKQAIGDRQSSAPANNSSPAQAAAARAHTVALQQSTSGRAHSKPTRSVPRSEFGARSLTTKSTLPTPPSGSQSSGQQAPTSAQRPPPSYAPIPATAQRFHSKALRTNGIVNDPIEDDDERYHGTIDDNILDASAHSEYVPEGKHRPRGRTRSRSLETILPDPNATSDQPTSSAQLPMDSSTTLAANGDAGAAPLSSSALDKLSSKPRSSSNKGGSTAKWSRTEDISILRGIKANMTGPIIIQTFGLERSESALRNRRIYLMKQFPKGKVPLEHEYYAEVEAGGPIKPDRSTSSQPQAWDFAQSHVLRNAMRAGYDAFEIRQKHFASRSEESVTKKMNLLWEHVIQFEKAKETFPDESVPLAGWTDQDSFKLRRAITEKMDAHAAWQKWFPNYPEILLQRKMAAYATQLQNLTPGNNTPSATGNPADQGAKRSDATRPYQPAPGLAASSQTEPKSSQQSVLPTSSQTVFHSTPSHLHRQRQESPQVVVTQRRLAQDFQASSSQLVRPQGDDKQTTLGFKRDKGEGRADGRPSGSSLRAQIAREYSGSSSGVQPQAGPQPQVSTDPQPPPPPTTSNTAPEVIEAAEEPEEAETVDLRSQVDADEYMDIDDIAPDHEKEVLRQLDRTAEGEQHNELYADDAANAKLSKERQDDKTPSLIQEVIMKDSQEDEETQEASPSQKTPARHTSRHSMTLADQSGADLQAAVQQTGASPWSARSKSSSTISPGKQLTQELELSYSFREVSSESDIVADKPAGQQLELEQVDDPVKTQDPQVSHDSEEIQDVEMVEASMKLAKTKHSTTPPAPKDVQQAQATQQSDDESQAFQTQDPATTRSQRQINKLKAADQTAAGEAVELPSSSDEFEAAQFTPVNAPPQRSPKTQRKSIFDIPNSEPPRTGVRLSDMLASAKRPASRESVTSSRGRSGKLPRVYGSSSRLPQAKTLQELLDTQVETQRIGESPVKPKASASSSLPATKDVTTKPVVSGSRGELGTLPQFNGSSSTFTKAIAAEDSDGASDYELVVRGSSIDLEASPSSSRLPTKGVTAIPVVTEPYDLRTPLTKPDANGCVMIGRPAFPIRMHLGAIQSDKQLWEVALRYCDNNKALARTKFEIDWLGFQQYIASCGKDMEEVERLQRKLSTLNRFFKAKERKKIDVNMKLEDWLPDHTRPDGDVGGVIELESESDDDDDYPSDYGSDFEDEEMDYGAVLPEEEEYPHGVDRNREIVEVEDEDEAEEDKVSHEPSSTYSLTRLVAIAPADEWFQQTEVVDAPISEQDGSNSNVKENPATQSSGIDIYNDDGQRIGHRPKRRQASPRVCCSPRHVPATEQMEEFDVDDFEEAQQEVTPNEQNQDVTMLSSKGSIAEHSQQDHFHTPKLTPTDMAQADVVMDLDGATEQIDQPDTEMAEAPPAAFQLTSFTSDATTALTSNTTLSTEDKKKRKEEKRARRREKEARSRSASMSVVDDNLSEKAKREKEERRQARQMRRDEKDIQRRIRQEDKKMRREEKSLRRERSATKSKKHKSTSFSTVADSSNHQRQQKMLKKERKKRRKSRSDEATSSIAPLHSDAAIAVAPTAALAPTLGPAPTPAPATVPASAIQASRPLGMFRGFMGRFVPPEAPKPRMPTLPAPAVRLPFDNDDTDSSSSSSE